MSKPQSSLFASTVLRDLDAFLSYLVPEESGDKRLAQRITMPSPYPASQQVMARILRVFTREQVVHRRTEDNPDCDNGKCRCPVVEVTCLPVVSIWSLNLFRGMVEVLFDRGSKKLATMITYEQLLSGLAKMVEWEEGDFIRNAKYVTAYPLARFLDNPLPIRPASLVTRNPEDEYQLFAGGMKRWFKNRLISRTIKNFRLWFGWLQTKRAASPVNENFIVETYVKHAEQLSTVSRLSWADQTEIAPYVKRIFAGFRAPRFKLYEASNSASFERSRSQGGARGEILSHAGGHLSASEDTNGDLLAMTETRPGTVVIERGYQPTTVRNVREALDEISGTRRKEVRRRLGALQLPNDVDEDHPYAEEGFEGNEFILRRNPYLQPHKHQSKKGYPYLGAIVHPILEPLKVRLITKGESWQYYAAKYLQGALWKFLRGFPQFKLIGEGLNQSHLDWMLSLPYPGTVNGDAPKIVSGDYDGATDTLKIQLTKLIFHEIMMHMPVEDQWLVPHLHQVIEEHVLQYILPKGHDLTASQRSRLLAIGAQIRTSGHGPRRRVTFQVVQRTGQLMGSPLSFPILCVANLVCYWMACEQEYGLRALDPTAPLGVFNPRFKPRQLPVLINGDDILFRASDAFYATWKSTIERVAGFRLSVGKNYIHKKYFTINSTPCHLSDAGRAVIMSYMNVGLLVGQSKLTGRQEQKAVPDWLWYDGAVKGAIDPIRAHGRFIHYHKPILDKVTERGRFNFFSDVYLGGLGLKPADGVVPKFTGRQRLLARLLRDELTAGFEGPASKFSVWTPTIVRLSEGFERSRGPPQRYHHVTVTWIPRTQPLAVNQREMAPVDLNQRILQWQAAMVDKDAWITTRPPPRKLRRALDRAGDLLEAPEQSRMMSRGLSPAKCMDLNLRPVEVYDPLGRYDEDTQNGGDGESDDESRGCDSDDECRDPSGLTARELETVRYP
jgi:hypothetical protein